MPDIQHRYGVSLTVTTGHRRWIYLVGQGPDVLTFTRNHPFLADVERHFNRHGRAMVRADYVLIRPAPQSSVVQGKHTKRKVALRLPAYASCLACVAHATRVRVVLRYDQCAGAV